VGEGFEQGPRPASYTPQSGGPESNTGGGVTVVEGGSQSPVSPLDFGMIETLGVFVCVFGNAQKFSKRSHQYVSISLRLESVLYPFLCLFDCLSAGLSVCISCMSCLCCLCNC
jgi:hypothetical protein